MSQSTQSKRVWEFRHFRLTAALILLVFFSSCAQFQSIFDASGQTSYNSSTHKFKNEQSANETQTQLDANARVPIVTKKGVYYFVAEGDTLRKIARTYKIDPEDLAQINNLFETQLVVGRRLFIPHKRNRSDYLSVTQILKDKKIESYRSNKKLNLIWPVKQFVLTSKYGIRHGKPHDGIDLSAKPGTPIYAAAEGKVIYAKRFSGYGNLLVLKHSGDYFTAYSHCQSLLANVGKVVKQGAQIATVGRTGYATGPHLHFEIHKGAKSLDPLTLMPDKK